MTVQFGAPSQRVSEYPYGNKYIVVITIVFYRTFKRCHFLILKRNPSTPSTPAWMHAHLVNRQTLITSFNFSKWKFVFLLLRVKIQIINSFKWNAIKMKWYVFFFLRTRLKYFVCVYALCLYGKCMCVCVCTAHEMTVAKLYETASRGQRKETTITKGDEKKSHKHFKWMDGQACGYVVLFAWFLAELSF